MGDYGAYFDARLCFEGDEEKTASLLDSYAQNKIDISNVNKVLELQHLQLFFEKNPEISGWDLDKYHHYKELANSVSPVIVGFFQGVGEDNVLALYNDCYVSYRDDFIEGIYKYKVYERFSKESIIDIIDGMHLSPEHLLKNKCFVSFFDDEITRRLQDVSFGGRFVVRYYLEIRSKERKYYIPNGLTKDVRVKIVQDYIDSEYVSPRDLQLIIEARNPELPISPKIKKRASKKYNDFFINNKPEMVFKHGFKVSFGSYAKTCSCRRENNIFYFEYDVDWINNNKDYPTLLNNFIYLFTYVDYKMMICSLALKEAHKSVVESIFMVKGIGMYETNSTFNMLESLADIQMTAYVNVLKRLSINLETVIKWFFAEYLQQEFSINGMDCNVPLPTDSLVSKCKTLPSAIDGVLSRYKMLCEDGEIDIELFDYISNSPRIKDVPSQIKNKYCYPGQNLKKEIQFLFSDQIMLGYTKRTKGKYSTLYELIRHEKITFDECEPYNIDRIKWLIERNVLCLKNGIICANTERLKLLKNFYEYEVISLQHFKSPILKELIEKNEVTIGSTLFTDFESHYFDYELNNSEYSNGRSLRNKYIHDSIKTDEKRMLADYHALLKIMIIIMIKINDDCCVKELVDEQGDYYEL